MKILINEKISPHRYKDNHGYLICTDCIMARTGKQTYTRDECFGDGDNTEIEVDRPSKEVFDAKTMASFENVPITIEHPSVNVDPDNYNTLSVGHMRDIRKGTYEGQPVMVGTAVITDSDAIEKVESGELTNLSCGYDCDIDDSENPHQFNIRGNHIALCECPRAGITHIQDSKKLAKKRYEVTIDSEDTMKDTKTKYYLVKELPKEIGDADDNWHFTYSSKQLVPGELFTEKELIKILDKADSNGSSVWVRGDRYDKLLPVDDIVKEVYIDSKNTFHFFGTRQLLLDKRTYPIDFKRHTRDSWSGSYNGGFWRVDGNRITITRKDGKWFTMSADLIKKRQDIYDYIDGIKKPERSIKLRDDYHIQGVDEDLFYEIIDEYPIVRTEEKLKAIVRRYNVNAKTARQLALFYGLDYLAFRDSRRIRK